MEITGRPLTAAMANVLAWRLGKICLEAASPDQKVGDYIDRGLILRRLLEEGGFHLVAMPEGLADGGEQGAPRPETRQKAGN